MKIQVTPQHATVTYRQYIYLIRWPRVSY